MRRLFVVLVLGLLGMVVVAGGFAANRLVPGVYMTTITGATPPVLDGTWRLALVPTSFTITKNGKLAVGGRIVTRSRTITFRDTRGPFRCTGPQATGTYGWSLRGKRLTLSVRRDGCSGRKAILTNGFIRSP